MRRFVSILLLPALSILLAGAIPAVAAPLAGKLKIVATNSIIGDWCHVVGGDDIELTTLVGPDGDSHEFEPAPSDTLSIAHADLVFENGLGLENWLDKLFTASKSTATRVVVTRGVDVRHVPQSEGGRIDNAADDRDPHAWQDVKDAAVMVTDIRDALVKTDPAHADAFASRADAYIAQLNALDAWVMQQIASIPAAHRKLVTSHNAFGYFGRRYGIEVSHNALESVTTEASDPSAKQLAEVIDQVRASGVPVIFLENIQNRKIIDQIASEVNVKVGPPLYSDALGKPGTAGDTYLKMIHYNVDTLVKALGP